MLHTSLQRPSSFPRAWIRTAANYRAPRGLLLVRADPKESQSDKPEGPRAPQSMEEFMEADAKERKKILEPESVPPEEVELRPAGGRPTRHGAAVRNYADEQDTRIDQENPDLDIPREEDIGSRI